MKRLILVAAALAVSACATVRPDNLIDAEARPLITSAETVLVVKSAEIGTEINVSNVAAATGGGLIPALIDSGINADRTAKAEEAAGPIRDKLIDFDFGAELQEDLARELATTGIEMIDTVELVRSEVADYRSEKVAKSKAPAVLFIDAAYSLSPDMGRIALSANAQMFPTIAELNAFKEKVDDDAKFEPSDNLMRKLYRSEAFLVEVVDGETLGALAATMPVEELVKSISMASDQLAKMIAADIVIDDTYEAK